MGGNARIDDVSANAIDLTKHKRSEIVPSIMSGLNSINSEFKRQHGLSLWSKELFQSREFLSGSAFHFVNLESIRDEDFVTAKKSVGDIDTQVDGNMKEMIGNFLDANRGRRMGPLALMSYKNSGNQYISLWSLKEFDINVQIDLELVEFGSNGRPTTWSNFSHSSAWDDIKQGIKGVAHKYLLSCLAHIGKRDVMIKAKTSRGKDKVIQSADKAFSVQYGLRQRIAPILNDKGEHETSNGLLVYRETDTSEGLATTDLNQIFQHFFMRDPSSEDMQQMNSFVGLASLIGKYLSEKGQESVYESFFEKLWGPAAQGLYRGDKEKDFREKSVMIRVLLDHISVSMNIEKDVAKEKQIETYYRGYK